MKKIVASFAAVLLAITALSAQGKETFSNHDTTVQSYVTLSWTGENGQTWTVTKARGDQEITGSAICMRCGTLTGQLTAAQQAAGIGTVSFKYAIPFSDHNQQITITIGMDEAAVTVVNAATLKQNTVYEVSSQAVNIASGETLVLKVSSSDSDARVTIDDLEWTAYSGGSQPVDPEPGTLAAPTASVATDISANGFTAHWSAVQNATSYSLAVWRAADNQQTDASPYVTSATSYAVTGLAANTTYYYNTTASASGYTASQASNTISVTTAAGSSAAANPYYNSANGLSGNALINALQDIITDGHKVVSYDGLWQAYRKTDNTAAGRVWDMYSNCTFTWGSDQCGNYSSECDCYNREHSVPKSWFGEKSPMKSDIVHVVPTDGKVNGMRSNYPFGEVGSATYTSGNGCKLGNSNFSGYSGRVFEPADEYKGDFARIYFYMATRYRNTSFTSGNGNIMFTYSNGTAGLTTYAVNLLLKWHRQDPVSEKETDRNDGIEEVQGNRNPFVDYPELAEYIWGTHKGEVWRMPGTALPSVSADSERIVEKIIVADGVLALTAARADSTVEYALYGIDGKCLLQGSFRGQTAVSIDRLGQGFYVLQARSNGLQDTHKILIR